MQKSILSIVLFLSSLSAENPSWTLGPFERIEGINPVLSPVKTSSFTCPIQHKLVSWEGDHTFNPGAVVRDNKVYLFYRAEDDYGQGIGSHTSRLGIAESSDGLHFKRVGPPVLFPDEDDQKEHEWPGGCEDPRIVETEDGAYVMLYTQWNRKTAVLGVATSSDLFHWKKHGYAFEKSKFGRHWSKSGSIVCRREGDRLIATKIKGKYWMYWGEKFIYAATSDDLISWEPIRKKGNRLLVVLAPRPRGHDSDLVEAGPPALLTDKGILLLYNGKNTPKTGDPKVTSGAYSAGQVLLDRSDPTRVIAQTDTCFFKPEKPYETTGQYKAGTVFVQGLVHFQSRWLLYYGGADSIVGVAVAQE